jgi:hypothetical protein
MANKPINTKLYETLKKYFDIVMTTDNEALEKMVNEIELAAKTPKEEAWKN